MVQVYRFFPDTQNHAFWGIFNQNDPPPPKKKKKKKKKKKMNQCVLDDAIKKDPKKSLDFLNSEIVTFKTYHRFLVATCNYS